MSWRRTMLAGSAVAAVGVGAWAIWGNKNQDRLSLVQSLSGEERRRALEWQPPSRASLLDRLEREHGRRESHLDLLIVGGGSVGCGCALEAASRGLRVACVERGDWAGETSSRSTKLVHGGVRYLEKAILGLDWGQFKLVREALQERAGFLQSAPHLAKPLAIMLPVYGAWWRVPYYWLGSKAYDWLSGIPHSLMNLFSFLVVRKSGSGGQSLSEPRSGAGSLSPAQASGAHRGHGLL